MSQTPPRPPRPHRPLPMPTMIISAAALPELQAALQGVPLLAVDTESNSMYAYYHRVCLVQLTTRDAAGHTHDFILDPLAIDDPHAVAAALAPAFADPATEKVFHAAEYDVTTLKRDFGVTFANVFDTMIAARLCGLGQVGLGALLERFFGVTTDKEHQRDDWGKRPLTADALLYAQMDTHYLPALRDQLAEQLRARGRETEARQRSEDMGKRPAAAQRFDPESYWRLVKPNRLHGREIARLQALYLAREQIAQARNLPPVRVFTDRALIQLARMSPRQPADLRKAEALTSAQAGQYGEAIFAALQQAETTPVPTAPPPYRTLPPAVIAPYTALLDWRREAAAARGIEGDLLIHRAALQAAAETMPETLDDLRDLVGVGAWRAGEFGDAILEVLSRFRKG